MNYLPPSFICFLNYHRWWSQQDGHSLTRIFLFKKRIQDGLDTTVWYTSQEKTFFY